MSLVKIESLVKLSGVAFGTSGMRGLVTQMTDEVCFAYVTAFLNVIKQSFKFKQVALGIDLRPSSPSIAAACSKAISSSGFSVDFCGAIPTPSLAYYAQKNNVPAIMVTGSHIPFDRNGIKFYRPDGEISKADELAMMEESVVLEGTLTETLPTPNLVAVNDYEKRYLDFFPEKMLAGLRLGLYEHSSVARDTLRRILEKFGAEVISLGRTDTFVPIDTEAVSEEDAKRGLDWAAEYNFDAIISTDGDGDRPLISDEYGHWLRGDIVGLLCARYLGVNKLAVPVSCNTAIEKSTLFNEIVRTKIGSPYVIAAMQGFVGVSDTIAGFEANGGFLLGSNINKNGKHLESLPTRDAVLPVLAVLAASRETNKPISDLVKSLPDRFTYSDRIQNFPSESSKRLIESWANAPAMFAAFLNNGMGLPSKQDVTDGLRFTFDNGDIIHLRPSGNAPELRCYCESSSMDSAVSINKNLLFRIRKLPN